jgi:hypothetical protein
MPRTIDEGFRDFLATLTPTRAETVAAMGHRASIEACLDANFGMSRFFRSGSFGNGTSIAGYSDVDYFASLRSMPSGDSSAALTRVRDALDRRFPFTGVRVDCPAVRVPFGTYEEESTEVVPATVVAIVPGDHLVYDIANCAGGWQRSSPDAHNAYVATIDGRLSSKVRPLVRFLKAWKYCQQVPISSFYLELRVTAYAATQAAIIYDLDILCFLSRVAADGVALFPDPLGISGSIAPCSTVAKLTETQSKLATALSRAKNACDARRRDDIAGAFTWWQLFYNHTFPSYYR